MAFAGGAAVGGGGNCERISIRRFARDLPLADINVSMSNATFFCRVVNDTKTILLFEICKQPSKYGLQMPSHDIL